MFLTKINYFIPIFIISVIILNQNIKSAAKITISDSEISREKPKLGQFRLDNQLSKAVEADDISEVEKLIIAGANVNWIYHIKNPDISDYVVYDDEKNIKTSIIFQAIKKGNEKIIDLLLNAGANVNLLIDSSGNALLHRAVIENDEILVEWLLYSGAIINCKNQTGETALDLAKKMPKFWKKINNFSKWMKRHNANKKIIALLEQREIAEKIIMTIELLQQADSKFIEEIAILITEYGIDDSERQKLNLDK